MYHTKAFNIISIVSALVGIYGYIFDKEWFMLIGAILALVIFRASITSSFSTLQCKLYALLGSAGCTYFLYHLWDIPWLRGGAISLSIISLLLAILLLLSDDIFLRHFPKKVAKEMITIAVALAGLFGFFAQIKWLMIAGAVVSIIAYSVAIELSKNILSDYSGSCRFLPGIFRKTSYLLLGAVLGMFVMHFSFEQDWIPGLTFSLCALCCLSCVIRVLFEFGVAVRAKTSLSRSIKERKQASEEDEYEDF